MSKVVTRELSTENKKRTPPFEHKGYEGAKDGAISVLVDCLVPETLEEAASEDFYGTETVLIDAIQEDWIKRLLNTARPVLRESERELDWQHAAQTAADAYKPGRKGGFAPRINESELDEINDLEQLKELLRKRGAVAA